jgi:hypothetical protein
VTDTRFQRVHRRLVAGTEVLRTGGGATLTAADCNAVLEELADLEWALTLVDEPYPISVFPEGVST